MKEQGNRKVIWLSIAAFVVMVALLWYFWSPGYNWFQHSFSENDDEPYGADLTYQYLKELRDTEKLIPLDSAISSNLRPYVEDSVQGHNYVILGYLPYLDSLSLARMLDFAALGNDIFLLTGTVDTELLSEWNQAECRLYDDELSYEYIDGLGMVPSDDAYLDSLVQMQFTHPGLRMDSSYAVGHYVKDELKPYRWSYLDSTYFCEENTSFTPLGTVGTQVNFFRVKYGRGHFYVHTNPKVLTNFYLTKDQGRAYADRVFAHLSDGPILWDEKEWRSQLNNNYYKDRYAQHDGPLSYVISQESLRWALYVLFIMCILLFLFGSRRVQRPIPVMRPKENSSMEYVDTISGLYYSESADGRIFKYISEQFQFFIRKRYRLAFKWEDTETWDLVAKASGVPLAHIQKITALHSKGKYEPNVDSQKLTEYYSLIEHFYTNSK